MLQKMGWSEGKGLGQNLDGMQEHIKVNFKADTLGVGADKRTVDNWMDNTSAFDALLQSLNTQTSESSNEEPKEEVDESAGKDKKKAKKSKKEKKSKKSKKEVRELTPESTTVEIKETQETESKPTTSSNINRLS
jgi:Pin2-interacting protein X1